MYAQKQVSQSIDSKLYGTVPYVIVGMQNKQVLICQQEKDGYFLKQYNEKMGLVRSMPMPHIPWEISKLVFIKKDTFYTAIFELLDKKGNYTISKQLYGASFIPIDSNVLLYSDGVEEKRSSIQWVQSEDKQYLGLFYIQTSDDEPEIKYSFYNHTTGKFTKASSTSIPFYNSATSAQLFISNKGNAAFLLGSLASNNAIEESYITAFDINAKSPKFYKLQTGANTYNYQIAKFNESTQEVIICYTYTESADENLNGLKRLVYNIDSQKVITKKDILVENITNRKKEIGSFDNYIPRQILLRNDGGLVYVAEYYEMQEIILGTDISGLNVSSSIPARLNRTVKRYNYGDLLLISLNGKDSIEWVETIHKEQVSENDDGFYSSFANLRLKSKFAIFFNATDKMNTVQLATINSMGEFKYSIINETKLSVVNMVVKKAKQISTKDIIIPCEKLNTFSFVKISE
jgi:hypothetical protein